MQLNDDERQTNSLVDNKQYSSFNSFKPQLLVPSHGSLLRNLKLCPLLFVGCCWAKK